MLRATRKNVGLCCLGLSLSFVGIYRPAMAAAMDYLPTDRQSIDILFRGYAAKNSKLKQTIESVLSKTDSFDSFSICNQLGHNCEPPHIEVVDVMPVNSQASDSSIATIRSKETKISTTKEFVSSLRQVDYLTEVSNPLISDWHNYQWYRFQSSQTYYGEKKLAVLKSKIESECGQRAFLEADAKLSEYTAKDRSQIAECKKGLFPYIYSPYVIPIKSHKFTPDSQIGTTLDH